MHVVSSFNGLANEAQLEKIDAHGLGYLKGNQSECISFCVAIWLPNCLCWVARMCRRKDVCRMREALLLSARDLPHRQNWFRVRTALVKYEPIEGHASPVETPQLCSSISVQS